MIVPKRWSRVGVISAGVTAAAIAIGSLLLRPSPAETLARSAAAESWRPLGRLSGFSYAPRPRHSAASQPPFHLRYVAQNVIAQRGAEEPHVRGVAELLAGKSRLAVATLTALASRDAHNATYWSDLAAARLEDAATSDDVLTIAQSLAAADHALNIDPEQPEGLFNRALALDALGLRFAAKDAWRRYLAIDPASSWAAEARERLAAASAMTRAEAWPRERIALDAALDRGDVAAVATIVRRFPLEARTAVELAYAPQWADAFLGHDAALAQKSLQRARLTAAALKTFHGDALLDRALASVDESAARGFQHYRQARTDNTARHVQESLDGFTNAEAAFAAAQNPMELSAMYFRANALIDLGRPAESEALARVLAQRVDPTYRSLHAFLSWARLRTMSDAGRHYDCLILTRAARDEFLALGELDHADRLRTIEAGMLSRLGRNREAWQAWRLALAGAAASGRWNLVEVALQGAAREEIDGPNRDVARALLNAQLAAPSTLPLTRFNALLWRAYLDPRTDAESIANAATRIPDAKQRESALDELHLMNALAQRATNPAAAERLFSQVIDYRTRVGVTTYVPAVYVQRARMRRALANDPGAERDLRTAIDLIEQRREQIAPDLFRDTFLGTSTDAYNDLAELLLARGDWRGAFAVSDRSRSRVLLDDTRRTAMSLDDIVAETPPDVVGAHYTTFDARTLIVVIEHGRAMRYVVPAGRAELQRLRDRMLSKPEGAADDAARRLYELLVAPFRDRLAPSRELIVAPDDVMYGIPFAALRDRDGRFLIEQTAISIAPAGAAIAASPLLLQPGRAHVAILADSAASPRLFPDLEQLPAARREARTLPRMFGRATTLVGEQVTRRAFASAIRDCDAVHIATHAFSSPRDASLSLIALAPEAGDDGLLYLNEIASLRFTKRPLVVLAGCRTASFGGGNGSIRSLAHAFLAAGGEAVLATLWKVDDERASELTTELYRNLATGATVPHALRDAQLRLMSTSPPSDWAAFQLHRGISPRTKNTTSGRQN